MWHCKTAIIWIKEKTKIYVKIEKNKTSVKSILVSGTILKVKGLYFGKEFGCDNFQASDGSLDKWKRYNCFVLNNIRYFFHFSVY